MVSSPRPHRLLLAAGLLLCLSVSALAHGHGHGHGHGHSHDHDEDPKFRWSREANMAQEDEIMEEDIVDIPTAYSNEKPKPSANQHGHGHHGHSHGHHGHSHGHHGHSHEPQREPTKEERERNRERLHRMWDDDDDDEQQESRTRGLWMYALLSTLGISLAPFVILFFISLDNSEKMRGRLKISLAFASGGLLGDAFLHLIPHAMMASGGGDHGHSHGGGHGHSHGGGHGHSHGGEGEEGHAHDLTVGLGVLAGILTFLIIEKTVQIWNGGSHGHSHGPPPPSAPKKDEDDGAKGDAGGKKSKKKAKKAKDSDAEEEDESDHEVEKKEEKKKKEKKADAPASQDGGEIKVAGLLNLAADTFHNFTDGLAIGASFLAGNSVGVATTIMIFFHEIPHEIGDYAILIQSGVPPFKAKCLQLVTAAGAFAGCCVSIWFGELGDAVTVYILPFTAGGFIYIATVSVIPELLEGTTFRQSLKEIAAIVTGIASMIVIGMYE